MSVWRFIPGSKAEWGKEIVIAELKRSLPPAASGAKAFNAVSEHEVAPANIWMNLFSSNVEELQ